MSDRLIDTAAVAERLNVPESTLRYWRHRGEGPPSIKLGRLVRYSAVALEQWLAAQPVVAS